MKCIDNEYCKPLDKIFAPKLRHNVKQTTIYHASNHRWLTSSYISHRVSLDPIQYIDGPLFHTYPTGFYSCASIIFRMNENLGER